MPFFNPNHQAICFPKNFALYRQFLISFLKIYSSLSYMRHFDNSCLEWSHQNLVGFATLDLCLQRSHMLRVFLWSS